MQLLIPRQIYPYFWVRWKILKVKKKAESAPIIKIKPVFEQFVEKIVSMDGINKDTLLIIVLVYDRASDKIKVPKSNFHKSLKFERS